MIHFGHELWKLPSTSGARSESSRFRGFVHGFVHGKPLEAGQREPVILSTRYDMSF